jgi:hypothetical protein
MRCQSLLSRRAFCDRLQENSIEEHAVTHGEKNPAAPAEPGLHPLPNVPYRMLLTNQPALVTGANSSIGQGGLEHAGSLRRAYDPGALQRIGQPQDVARAAVWLASDSADYLTDATLFVRGMTFFRASRQEANAPASF